MSFAWSSPSPASTVLYQASIETPAELAEGVAAALESAMSPAALAVTLFDKGAGRAEVSAHYAAEPCAEELAALIQEAALGRHGLGAWRVEPLPDQDWVRISQSMRPPVRAGRFLVHGSHDRHRVPRARFAIEIDAGQAFGTAHHASTRGCLLALDELIKRRRPRRVLDIGTGTGILAIASAKALRVKVKACDNDPVAVAIAADNARQNRVGSRVSVVKANGLAHPDLRHTRPELLLANLLLGPLLDLAPAMARAVAPGGAVMLSGITQGQSPAVEARFGSLGFRLERRILLDGWTTLLLVRRSMGKVRRPRLIATVGGLTRQSHVSKLR
jgi:ribosomal protein L11 methyltransferase